MPIDFIRGAKVAGSKFYFSKGDIALEEWDLIDKMIRFHVANGYEFIIPPYVVKRQVGEWAGILPKFEGDYYQTKEGLMLIPTAETPLVGMHANETFKENELPKKYVAFSPCFRKEAGSYGKRDRGLRRVHQFHYFELFTICKPEDSYILQEKMVRQVVFLLELLGVKNIKTRELSESERSPVSKKTIDVEIECGDEWLEVSSISNTEDNQSKPARIKYTPKSGGKNIRVHLLNGSGVALPRLLLALRKKKSFKSFSSSFKY